MKPRRTIDSNHVFALPGGTEDNDLWVEVTEHEVTREPVICSVWELTVEERRAIMDGANVELVVWGMGHPPVAMNVTDVELGKGGQGRDGIRS